LGEEQATALTAGKGLDEAPGSMGREQEILKISNHVSGLAVDQDRVVVADVLLNRRLLVEGGLQLVEVGNLQSCAVPDCPRLRRQVSQQELKQRRLARAIRPDDPNLVAALDRGREVTNNRLVAVAEGCTLGFDDQTAGTLGLLELHLRRALPLPSL